VEARGRDPGDPARAVAAYWRGSFTELQFVPPRLSLARTLRVSVPGWALVFGVTFAVHVVEETLVIVTVREASPGS
jgi:hypothetical protein